MSDKSGQKLGKWAEKAYRASIEDIEREFVEVMNVPELVSRGTTSTKTALSPPRMDIPKATYRQIYTEHVVLFPYGGVSA